MTKHNFQKPRVEADHPVLPLILTRYSPRAFKQEMIPQEEFFQLLEAARWAPSSMNEQPWRFIYAFRGEDAFSKMIDQVLMEGNAFWAKEASILIINLTKKAFSNGKSNKTAWHDLGLAMGNLTLQATSMGIGVHQMAGIFPEKARDLFGVAEEYEVVSAAALGYYGLPEQLEEPLKSRELSERSRKQLHQFAYHGTFENKS
jgi:nitroreductase